MSSHNHTCNEYPEDEIENRFEQLYPEYHYSTQSSIREKDSRKRKRLKTIY
ncbi:MAG: hypothetical protein OES14_05270 [Nitrosopumilus sp.]|nr:hypothetical protein [Nitrosopumilus sp.]MDH3825183.1 hypothetical protein [Nitrosopumilus sp.]